MSIVPQRGILRKHYEQAVDDEDVEYKSSAFWQKWLQLAFHESERYSVTCESSPDETRRRVDIVVKRYNSDQDTLYALLWVECKRPKESPHEVEAQVHDAALRCLQEDKTAYIYVMTTIGVSFRTWVVLAEDKRLLPLHGTAERGARKEYIDADSEDASVLLQTVEQVKTREPLRIAPIIPSQSAAQYPESNAQAAFQDYTQQQIQAYLRGNPDVTEQQLQAYLAQYQQVQSSVQADAYPDNPFIGEQAESSTAPQSGITQRTWNNVKVTRKTHRFHADEYVFRDATGNVKSTEKKDWVEIEAHGRTAWAYHGKHTSYITYDSLG